MSKIATKLQPLLNEAILKAKPKLRTALFYAKAEMSPPSPAELPAAFKGYANLIRSFRTGSYKQLTVKQAWLNTLVGMEIICWFFVGECIGKGGLIGYNV